MSDIAIIDIEASGLHFDSYPIEIAVLKGNEVQSWLIKPEPAWTYWCEIAESLHGISRETLFREGRPAVEVVQQLNEFLLGFDGALYSDADRWDVDWVDTLYFATRQARPFHIASIYDLLSVVEARRFQELIAQLPTQERYRHHRAASDVKMLQEAYTLSKVK